MVSLFSEPLWANLNHQWKTCEWMAGLFLFWKRTVIKDQGSFGLSLPSEDGLIATNQSTRIYLRTALVCKRQGYSENNLWFWVKLGEWEPGVGLGDVMGSLAYWKWSDSKSGMVFLIPSKTFSYRSIVGESLPFWWTDSTSVMNTWTRQFFTEHFVIYCKF